MNQILITEKLYVTPELKKKKKIYQLIFLISLVLVFILSSYYIYAEYDRDKNEELAQEILNDTTVKRDDSILRVSLEEDDNDIHIIDELDNKDNKDNTYVASDGKKYDVDAVLNIPSLGINYPVLSETSDELLKIGLNKFWGPNPNEIGNYCIVGHNTTHKRLFSKLSNIKNGDTVELTDNNGKTLKYIVYNKYVIVPEDLSCTSQLTNGNKEVTLITCTNGTKQRLVVKARQI